MSVRMIDLLPALYERDETAWLEAMAELARDGWAEDLDLGHLAEYLFDRARRDRREVESRLIAKSPPEVDRSTRSSVARLESHRDRAKAGIEPACRPRCAPESCPGSSRRRLHRGGRACGRGDRRIARPLPGRVPVYARRAAHGQVVRGRRLSWRCSRPARRCRLRSHRSWSRGTGPLKMVNANRSRFRG